MTPPPLQGAQLHTRFRALSDLLLARRPLWQPRPFNHRVLPWEAEHGELAQWLRQRPLSEADAPAPASLPAPFMAWQAEALALSHTAELPSHPLAPAPARLSVDVPGRKWQQIEAFTRHLPSAAGTPRHWLDWCAGKGHLGRRLTQPGQRLTCLEHDPALVAAGQQLSQHHGVHAEHLQQDVMAAHCAQHLHSATFPVALHACGDLHVRLMQLASQQHCQQLAIAPCCYNRIAGQHYTPLSTAAQASGLHLSRDDLGLPLSETVTAGARVRRQRDHSMARRLGFDLLQRQLRNADSYLPTPSLGVHWLAQPFAAYCQHLCQLKGLPPPTTADWPALESAGWHRLAQVRNLERVRNLYRRPLELWLLLDRALYLQEQGYDVQLGQFCDYALTPRNLMLLARRTQSH